MGGTGTPVAHGCQHSPRDDLHYVTMKQAIFFS
jgi:hypothetical protein